MCLYMGVSFYGAAQKIAPQFRAANLIGPAADVGGGSFYNHSEE